MPHLRFLVDIRCCNQPATHATQKACQIMSTRKPQTDRQHGTAARKPPFSVFIPQLKIRLKKHVPYSSAAAAQLARIICTPVHVAPAPRKNQQRSCESLLKGPYTPGIQSKATTAELLSLLFFSPLSNQLQAIKTRHSSSLLPFNPHPNMQRVLI